MWMGCAIFCRRASGGGFYAPRVELNDAGLDPYFPDGTWCHHDGSHHYYCLQHHCLPEVRSKYSEIIKKTLMVLLKIETLPKRS